MQAEKSACPAAEFEWRTVSGLDLFSQPDVADWLAAEEGWANGIRGLPNPELERGDVINLKRMLCSFPKLLAKSWNVRDMTNIGAHVVLNTKALLTSARASKLDVLVVNSHSVSAEAISRELDSLNSGSAQGARGVLFLDCPPIDNTFRELIHCADDIYVDAELHTFVRRRGLNGVYRGITTVKKPFPGRVSLLTILQLSMAQHRAYRALNKLVLHELAADPQFSDMHPRAVFSAMLHALRVSVASTEGPGFDEMSWCFLRAADLPPTDASLRKYLQRVDPNDVSPSIYFFSDDRAKLCKLTTPATAHALAHATALDAVVPRAAQAEQQQQRKPKKPRTEAPPPPPCKDDPAAAAAQLYATDFNIDNIRRNRASCLQSLVFLDDMHTRLIHRLPKVPMHPGVNLQAIRVEGPMSSTPLHLANMCASTLSHGIFGVKLWEMPVGPRGGRDFWRSLDEDRRRAVYTGDLYTPYYGSRDDVRILFQVPGLMLVTAPGIVPRTTTAEGPFNMCVSVHRFTYSLDDIRALRVVRTWASQSALGKNMHVDVVAQLDFVEASLDELLGGRA